MRDYYPRTFEGIVGQPEATERIRGHLAEPPYPNFLFHGPSGTGKTATAYLIAELLQGSRDELMEFNSSNDRRIDDVRERIIPATKQTTLSGAPMVIFLDEMEAMTKEAQQALRPPMQKSSAVFILACNEVDAVHSALQSRCRSFHYDALADSAIKKRVRQLAERDGIDLTERHLKTIVTFADGDMRGAILRYEEVVQGHDDGPVVDFDAVSLEREARQYSGD